MLSRLKKENHVGGWGSKVMAKMRGKNGTSFSIN